MYRTYERSVRIGIECACCERNDREVECFYDGHGGEYGWTCTDVSACSADFEANEARRLREKNSNEDPVLVTAQLIREAADLFAEEGECRDFDEDEEDLIEDAQVTKYLNDKQDYEEYAIYSVLRRLP